MAYKSSVLCGCILILCVSSSYGYIGPGVGVTMIGWLVGAGVMVGVALWAMVSLPIRMLLKRNKRSRPTVQEPSRNEEPDYSAAD